MGENKLTAGSTQVSLATIPRVHEEAAVRQVGGRWIAATADNRLHTFAGPEGVSQVGERIVSLVDGVRSVGDIAGLLVDEFEVSREVAEADTLEFISQLIHKQVLSA